MPTPPFPNEPAARASNGGALPPDMGCCWPRRARGRAELHLLSDAYQLRADVPVASKVANAPPGKYYNPIFPGDLSSTWTGKGDVPPGGFHYAAAAGCD